MLYVIYMRNEGLGYRGGQEPIIHLEADLHETVNWARRRNRRWAFTFSTAGIQSFRNSTDLTQLSEIDWEAVNSDIWLDKKDGKQAEFLVEKYFPWELIRKVGVISVDMLMQAGNIITANSGHVPVIEQRKN